MLCVAFLVSVASASALEAQAVRGRVIDAATRQPITGAHVMLLNADGERVARALSNEDGVVLLLARRAGEYTVHVEMIGRHSIESDVIRVADDQVAELTLELSPRPISLQGLHAEGAQRCEIRPGVGELTHTVWEEARKALAVEAAVRAEGRYRYSILRYERETDVARRRITSQNVRHINRFTGDPFYPRDPEYLLNKGYFEAREDGNWLWAPNADVLLSDGFLDTHCFYLKRQPERPAQVGLAFEPVQGRTVPEIEGTLWLQEATAELLLLEFNYVNLPTTLPDGPRGGRAEFQRLPSGAFIINAWNIYSPIVQRRTTGVGVHAQPTDQLIGFLENGAEVLSIVDRDGVIVKDWR